MDSTPCNVETITSAFIAAEAEVNPIIANKTRKYKAIYRDMIPRGTFNYGEGYTKYNETFYGGLAIQDAGASWASMAPYRAPGTNGQDDPGHDPCKYQGEVIGYGFERKSYTVYEANRRTLDICLTDIMFDWQFEQQLNLIYQALSNVTLGEWEQITRETYIGFATKYWALKSLTGWGLEPIDPQPAQWSQVVAIPAGGLADIGKLNQSILDRVYQWLSRQAPEGAIANKNGMPIFGLITSMETSAEMITQDVAEREAFLYADPNVLIEGYGTLRTHKGFAHIHDFNTPRFAVNVDAELERVWPYTATATTIGNAINVDSAYIKAPFEYSVIFLQEVYTAQVPPPNPAKIGKGYDFNPQDNFGTFKFINEYDRCENPRREKGFFDMRMRMAPEPGIHSNDAVVILHRRCDLLEIEPCGECTPEEKISVVSCAQFDEDEALGDAVKYIVELDSCIPCTIGQEITVIFDGALEVCALIADDWGAPFYVIIFETGTVLGWCNYDGGMDEVECECDRGQV